MWRLSRPRVWIGIAVLIAAAAAVWFVAHRAELAGDVKAADHRGAQDEGNGDSDPAQPIGATKRKVSDDERAALLRRAQVWQAPRTPVADARLAPKKLDELSCKFKVDDLGGTTPKFDCLLETGEEIRIKYGNGPEVPAELAATRLLRALGFGADEVTLVRTLRCYGCPKEPFSVMKVVEITRAEPLYELVVDYTAYETFEWVALERKFDARQVETEQLEGWSFFELAQVTGSPREHIDALRLMAVLLAHWDNKAENQRLVCLDREWPEGAPCERPFLLLQDLGATFGPTKVDLSQWEAYPVWSDRRACTLSMRRLPFGGATFVDVTVSERGRQFMGHLLSQLSDAQIAELFAEARFGEKRGFFAPISPVRDWVRVFKQKVTAITAGPACPTA